jgi:hypothetical protein
MYKTEHDSILEALCEEYRLAKLAYGEANHRFDSIRRDVPSCSPDPDSMLRIQIAYTELNTVHWKFMQATERLNQYILDGQVMIDAEPRGSAIRHDRPVSIFNEALTPRSKI